MSGIGDFLQIWSNVNLIKPFELFKMIIAIIMAEAYTKFEFHYNKQKNYFFKHWCQFIEDLACISWSSITNLLAYIIPLLPFIEQSTDYT